ncbi:MAG: hypothetical protein ACPGJS_00800 [Flammeovirgaceae bacterium]
MNKKDSLIGIIAIGGFVGLLMGFYLWTRHGHLPKEVVEPISEEQQFRGLVSAFNELCPRLPNEKIRIDSLSIGENNSVIYHIVLLDQINNSGMQSLNWKTKTTQWLINECLKNDLAITLSKLHNSNLILRCKDKNGVFITDLLVLSSVLK